MFINLRNPSTLTDEGHAKNNSEALICITNLEIQSIIYLHVSQFLELVQEAVHLELVRKVVQTPESETLGGAI